MRLGEGREGDRHIDTDADTGMGTDVDTEILCLL